jgi:hypothetical protein
MVSKLGLRVGFRGGFAGKDLTQRPFDAAHGFSNQLDLFFLFRVGRVGDLLQ